MLKRTHRASAGRFKTLLETYPEYDDKEKIYYHLARVLLLDNNLVEGRIYADKLLADFPDTRYEKQVREVMRVVGEELTLDVDGHTN